MGVIKINGVTYGGDNSVMLTQAEYDALVDAGTVDPTVLYMITDRNLGSTPYAAGIIYDNTDSGLDATNVQNAIDEIVEDGIPSDTIPYDNAASGLTATNVQTAIDELAETGGGAGVSVLTYAEYQELVEAGEVNPDISYYISDSNTTGTNYAAGISYDNTESGLTATDVQEAIDELSSIITTSTDSVTGTKWTVKKYSNGDMEIWGNKYYTPDSDISFTAWGAWYGVTFTPGTYPQTFYSIPCVVGQVQIENVGGVSSIQATPSVSAAPQITVMRPTAATISTTFHINICVYARGRWKA